MQGAAANVAPKTMPGDDPDHGDGDFRHRFFCFFGLSAEGGKKNLKLQARTKTVRRKDLKFQARSVNAGIG